MAPCAVAPCAVGVFGWMIGVEAEGLCWGRGFRAEAIHGQRRGEELRLGIRVWVK